MRKSITFTINHTNEYAKANKTSCSSFEENDVKDIGRYNESKRVENDNRKAIKVGKKCRPSLIYNATGKGIGTGDNINFARRSYIKALKKVRLMLEDLTGTLIQGVSVRSKSQSTQLTTQFNAPQTAINAQHHLPSRRSITDPDEENKNNREVAYFSAKIPLHGKIVQCNSEDHMQDNGLKGGGHYFMIFLKAMQEITNAYMIANVKLHGLNQHGAVDELEMNHSNSSRCGCNRSFTDISHVQGLSSGRRDDCGTWGQMRPDPGRKASSFGKYNSGVQNVTKYSSGSSMNPTNDFSNEVDIKKISSSCVRRFTLEESKALATSPSLYTSDFCYPIQKSSDNMKSAASCSGEQVSRTSRIPGQKVEGEPELSRNPISSPNCEQSYPRIRYNESVRADLTDGQCRRGLQSSSMCRLTKPQNDKGVRKFMENFDDSTDFCSPDYSQCRSPTGMLKNPANRKSGRQSPCRIAITGCERPFVPPYRPPNISNPEIDLKADFSGSQSDHDVCGGTRKSTSRSLNARKEDFGGGSGALPQRLAGGKKVNRDCCQQSERYPTSSSKWHDATAKDVSRNYLQSNRPQDSRNEDQESRYGADGCQKSSGGYSFQIKYTEVEGADSPSIPDASENDCFNEPNQLQVKNLNYQSFNTSLHRSSCKTPSNPQYATGKNLVEGYDEKEGGVGYQDCENIDGDTRAYSEDYYSNEPRVPQFLQNKSRCERIRSSRQMYEEPSAKLMQRCQQNHFIDVSRSPPQPQHRCMEDMGHSPKWLGCMKDSECTRCMSRAHSEEYPSPYPVCKKTCGFRRKRSRKRCVSRRQKCSGRPRKVVRLSRRASMELERRYAPQVHRSESSLTCDAARNSKCCTAKRRNSQPESLFEDPLMSGENRKCLCRSPSLSRCVVVNPCYRNNRAAFLRKKFNEARIDEEDDPCCCATLFRSTPVRGTNHRPCQFSESAGEMEGGSLDCCPNGEQEERDACRELRTSRSRSPVSSNGCQPRENGTEANKCPCGSNTPRLNIDLDGKQIMLKKYDNTTNCASSELMLPEKACEKNAANNGISISLGDKTIIIKNPGSTDQVCFESKCGKWALDSRSQSRSSCLDSVVSRPINSPKQRCRKSPCKRRCGSAAVRKRSTPLKSCSLKETSSCECSASIKPSVCQPTVCVALDYVPDVQEPPSKAHFNRCCSPTKRTQPKGSSGFCACTQISNGAMPCSKRPTIINPPSSSFPPSGGPRTTPLRQWNAPPTRQPGSAANSTLRSKSISAYNVPSNGSQRSGRKSAGPAKASEASGEPSKKTAPTQTSEEEGNEGDKVEKCTQCAKKMGFFARMCDKIKRKCIKNGAQDQICEEVDDDEGGDDDGDDDDESKCLRVNDTTSCSLRYNETRSYNCSACSTSRCVSNQSHSFMDLTDDPTTNLQLTMRSCNNTAREPYLGHPAIEQCPLTNSKCCCKSEKAHCKTGQLQCEVDGYRMGSCPTASEASTKHSKVEAQPQVTDSFCQEAKLCLPSCTKSEMLMGEGIKFNLNEAWLFTGCEKTNKCYCFPLLAFSYAVDDYFGQAKGPQGPRNCHRFAQCPCHMSSDCRCKVIPESGAKNCEMKHEMEAYEKSKNSNNFPSRMNTFDCCVMSMRKEGPAIEGQKAASSQQFTRNSMAHFVHDPSKKLPHQGTTSVKNACVRLRRPDKPLFQTLNRPRYEVLALFKRPLTKCHVNESMVHEPQKAKYPSPHCQPALRKVRTDPQTIKSKTVDTPSRWARMCTPCKKGSHAFQNGRSLENLGEADNRRFSATKSTNEFTCGRVESALLSPSYQTFGFDEVRPICKQPVVFKPPVKSKSGLDIPLCTKKWPQLMPKFQPASVRTSSFVMSHGNSLSFKPAFLPRNSAPSLHSQGSYGPIPLICAKASLNNMYPNHSGSSFDLKPVNLSYGSTNYENYRRGENHMTRFPNVPPTPCQRICSSEVASVHKRPIEVTKLKSVVAPEGKEKFRKPWQGCEKASAIKVLDTALIPHVIGAPPLYSVSNSFKSLTSQESISVQPIRTALQTSVTHTVPKCTSIRCQNDRFPPNSRIAIRSPLPHDRTSSRTNVFEKKANADVEPSVPFDQEKQEKDKSRYSFQVEGRRFHVEVDKEGVFHVHEMVKPPENRSFLAESDKVVNNDENSGPVAHSVNSEQSTKEIQSQTSPSAQLEPESSEKSVEVNETFNKCSTSRSKNSSIHEILRRSIKSLSGKLTPKFSCHANQQVGNSHTVAEKEQKLGNENEYFFPLTASEMSSQVDSKEIATKVFATDSPCNQNDHQAMFSHCRRATRRDTLTHCQMLIRSLNAAAGSRYSDASPRRSKKKRVHSDETLENVNEPVLCTYPSNYKTSDYAEKADSWADEGDCVVEDIDTYPQTKNSTLFNYDCQSATETSVRFSTSMSMSKRLRLRHHHFSLLGFSEGEEDSTRPRVESKESIIRPNSAPLFLRKITSPNHLSSNHSIPEPALSNSDTDSIIKTPFSEDYCDLQGEKEAQTQINLTNRNNSAQWGSNINTGQISYQREWSIFSNQTDCLKSCHEQVTYPQLTTPWLPRLLPPLNDSLICGDVKKPYSVEKRAKNNADMFPMKTDKDDTPLLLRNDDKSTESTNEKSNSAKEDTSLMSATLTLLLEGLCGNSGSAMDSCVSSTGSARQLDNTKNRKRSYCTSIPSFTKQNKSEGKRIEISAHNCSTFKENKAFRLRKRQNCNHTSVRCVTCLKKQRKQPVSGSKMHIFANKVLKHPFRKARENNIHWTKDSIFKKISKCSRRPEARRRRRSHTTKPSGDRCCASHRRSSSRPRTWLHTSSCCNRLSSFGIDTDGLRPNTPTECYTFQSVEPFKDIEQPNSDFIRGKCKLFGQCSDVSAALRSGSSNQDSGNHIVSTSSPKHGFVSMATDEDDDDLEAVNSAKLSNSNFTLSRLHDAYHAPMVLSHNSSSKPEACHDLMGDCMANRRKMCLKMKNTSPIWNVKALTPPLQIMPSSESQSDDTPFVSSHITSLNAPKN